MQEYRRLLFSTFVLFIGLFNSYPLLSKQSAEEIFNRDYDRVLAELRAVQAIREIKQEIKSTDDPDKKDKLRKKIEKKSQEFDSLYPRTPTSIKKVSEETGAEPEDEEVSFEEEQEVRGETEPQKEEEEQEVRGETERQKKEEQEVREETERQKKEERQKEIARKAEDKDEIKRLGIME